MGKKSRTKQLRREAGGDISASRGRHRKTSGEDKTGLEKFFVFLVYAGVYLALITPLIVGDNFYFPFVGAKSLFFMAMAEIVIFAWACLMIISKKYRPKFNLIIYSLVAFFAVITISSIFGVDFTNSFWSKFERMTGILMWIHLLGFTAGVVSVFKTQKKWRNIFAVSIIIALIPAIMSMGNMGDSTRGGATIGNTSFLGTYLLFNIFFAVYLFFKQKELYWKIPSAIAFCVMAFAVYKAGARAATLSIIGGIILLALLYLAFEIKKKGLNYLARVLLIACLIAFVAGCFLMLNPESFVRQKFVQTASKARIVVWEKAWKGFKEKPILGWGQENFEFVFEKYFNPCMFLSECGGEIWFDRAHNIIFDVLVTSGIAGLLSYLFIFIACFLVLWKSYFKKKISFLSAGIPSVILIAYTVQNLTVFDMVSSYLMFFLTIGFCIVISLQKKETEQSEIPATIENQKNKNLIILGFSILLLISLIIFVIQPLKADHYVISALQAQTSSERIELYEKTLNASPVGRYQIREFFTQNSHRIMAADAQKIFQDETLKQAAKTELDFVAEHIEKTRQANPLDFRSVLRLAQLYNLHFLLGLGGLEKAEELSREAVALSPTNQQGYWSLTQSLVYQQKFDEAYEAIQQAIDLEPREPQSFKVAIQIARMTGDMEKGEEFIQQAILIEPGWEEQLRNILSGEERGGDV